MASKPVTPVRNCMRAILSCFVRVSHSASKRLISSAVSGDDTEFVTTSGWFDRFNELTVDFTVLLRF